MNRSRELWYVVSASVSVIVLLLLAAFPQDPSSSEDVRWWGYLIGVPIGANIFFFQIAMMIDCLKSGSVASRVWKIAAMFLLPIAFPVIHLLVSRNKAISN